MLMNPSWWGRPEYNGIKVLILAVVVAGAGYFAYNSSHNNGVDSSGQVVKSGSGTINGSTTATGLGGGTTTTTGTTCALAVATDAATSVSSTSEILNGHFVTVCGTTTTTLVPITMHFEWGTSTAYGNTTATVTGSATPGFAFGPTSVDTLAGLTCGKTYNYRAVGTFNPPTSAVAYGANMTFVPACTGSGPVVVTDSAASITTTSATIRGHINSLGSGATTITSRFFTSSTFTPPAPVTTVLTFPPTTLPFAMSRNVTGLHCGTAYSYTANATNGLGLTGSGSPVSFTTLSCTTTINAKIIVYTDPATAITDVAATLNGELNNSGGSFPVTSEGIDYVPAVGGATITAPVTVASPITAPPTAPMSANVTGLTCNTRYNFRAWASGASGMNYGGWLSFTTSPCGGGIVDTTCTDATVVGPLAVSAVAMSPVTVSNSTPPMPPAISHTDYDAAEFNLKNNSHCTIYVTSLKVGIANATYPGGYAVFSSLKLYHAGVQFGSTVATPTTVAPDTYDSATFSVPAVYPPTAPNPIIAIAPGTSTVFKVVATTVGSQYLTYQFQLHHVTAASEWGVTAPGAWPGQDASWNSSMSSTAVLGPTVTMTP